MSLSLMAEELFTIVSQSITHSCNHSPYRGTYVYTMYVCICVHCGCSIMLLLDGDSCNDPAVIPVHPDFRMIALANRPGFPFLGNDFYAALGNLLFQMLPTDTYV